MVGYSKVTPRNRPAGSTSTGRQGDDSHGSYRMCLATSGVPVSRRAHSLSRIPTSPSATPARGCGETWTDFALRSIDLRLMGLGSVPNSDQQTKTSTSECRFAVRSSWRKGVRPRADREQRLTSTVANPSWGFGPAPERHHTLALKICDKYVAVCAML